MKLSLTSQAGLLAGSRAAGQVLNALVGIVVVRYLTQNDFGTFRQIYLLFGTLLVLTDLGITETLYYFLPRQPEGRARLMLRSALAVAVIQIAVGAGMVAFRGAIGRFFNNADLASYIGPLALYLGLSVVARVWEVQLVAEQRIVLVAWVTAGFEALKVGLVFAALATASGVGGLLWALVAGAALKFAGFLWFLGREFSWKMGPGMAGESSGQMSYAMALWVPGMLNVAAIQAHQYIVGYSFSPADYALYSVACFQVPLLGVLTSSILEVMLVRITAARAQQRYDEIEKVWTTASMKSLLIFVPMSVMLAVMARPLIVLLFTRTYVAAAPLFVILMLGLPLNTLFTNNVLRAYGEMKDYARFYAAKLVLGLVLGIVGVRFLGLWGVALSAVVASYLISGWQLIRVSELLKLPFARVLPWKDIGKMLLTSVAAAFPAMLCAEFITRPFPALAVGTPVYGVTFLFLALRIGLVRREEIGGLVGSARAGFERLGLLRAKTVGTVLMVLLFATWIVCMAWAQ